MDKFKIRKKGKWLGGWVGAWVDGEKLEGLLV